MCLQKHDIPISAVPCLKYRRELDKERQPQQHHDSEPTASGSPVDGLYLILFKNKQTNKNCFLMIMKNMSVISVGQIYPYRGAIYTTSQVQPMLHSAWIGHRLLHLHYL